MLKLVEVTSGYETNWHSILEQTTGLFNGLALAVAMAPLARSAPAVGRRMPTTPSARRRTATYALAFVVLGITYLNLRKNVGQWLQAHAVPEQHGRPLRRGLVRPGLSPDRADLPGAPAPARARPLAIVPPSPMGRGQLLYVVLLWWLVAGNFERIVVAFTAQRLVTEGVIGVVALACTLIVLAWPPPTRADPGRSGRPRPSLAGADAGGGPGGGGRRHRRRLGRGPRRPWRSVRGPREPAHPVRPERDDPPGRETMSRRSVAWPENAASSPAMDDFHVGMGTVGPGVVRAVHRRATGSGTPDRISTRRRSAANSVGRIVAVRRGCAPSP